MAEFRIPKFHSRKQDLLGKTIGKFSVLEYLGINHRGSSMWRCRCACGKEVVLPTMTLNFKNKEGKAHCGCSPYSLYYNQPNKSRQEGNLRIITLTQGKEAIILEDDWDTVRQFHWCLSGEKGSEYVRVGKKGGITLHRFLLPGHEYVDHIDGDRMNNVRTNLRPATHLQNCRNQNRKRRGCTSRFIGVSRCRPDNWVAYITINYKMRVIGHFKTELEAARARQHVAVLEFGEFAGKQVENEIRRDEERLGA